MRRTYVHPSGPDTATLAIVGEQPGLEEVRARPPKPFVGKAGKALDECLLMTKIIKREIYLTNVIKDLDQPLTKYINVDSRNSTISKEGYQYIQELGDELSKLKNLNCILALGNVALLALTNRVGITKWRGSTLESTLIPGLKIVPTFHPATILPDKRKYLNKPLICEDLTRAKHESTFKEISRRPREIIVAPTFDESVAALDYCYQVGLRGQTIALDIEVMNGELDCISFGWSPEHAISIPFRDHNGDYFTVDQELEIMRLISKIVQEEKITKLGANFIFDTQFLFNHYGIHPRGINNCTQIAQKISYPDYSAGLDFVTTMYTDIPYYKADGKKWMKMQAGTWKEWWNYNGMDAVAPIEAFPKQRLALKKLDNLNIYDRHRRLQEPLIYMSERGIKVDVEGMVKYKEEQSKQLDTLKENLNEKVGHEINHNSPKQLMDYFYKECGIKPYKKRNAQGKYTPSSDVDALKRIARLNTNGSEAARLMLDMRSLSKRISTYLNVGKVDNDGRYRSAYKPTGTETGRLASGETIFGTGGNQQNWPHDLLRFFIFDDGYIGYAIDLSQIENRIVAYVGGVVEQIEAFETGTDLHTLTASVILQKPYNEISNEDGSSDLGDGRQSERYWGKKGNHAINYDVGYKTFALKNEIQETIAKQLIETLHRGYPQIRGGYHVVIQNMLKHNRTVTNLFGRNRLFLSPTMPSPPMVPKSACIDTYRKAYAHLPQSTCADKINEQGILFIYENQDLFAPVEILSQVHDSVVFQIPKSIPLLRHAEIILAIKDSLETPLKWHDREIQTPADLSIGSNMCKEDMAEIKSKQIPSNPNLLADKISEVINE